MSPWQRPVKSHILNRARPRWKNNQPIFPKNLPYFFTPFFFFLILFFFFLPCICVQVAPVLQVSFSCSQIPCLLVKPSILTSVELCPIVPVLAWGTPDIKRQTPPEKGSTTPWRTLWAVWCLILRYSSTWSDLTCELLSKNFSQWFTESIRSPQTGGTLILVYENMEQNGVTKQVEELVEIMAWISITHSLE